MLLLLELLQEESQSSRSKFVAVFMSSVFVVLMHEKVIEYADLDPMSPLRGLNESE